MTEFLDRGKKAFVNGPFVCRFTVAIMVDTEGSEVHTSELEHPIKAEVGQRALRPCATHADSYMHPLLYMS